MGRTSMPDLINKSSLSEADNCAPAASSRAAAAKLTVRSNSCCRRRRERRNPLLQGECVNSRGLRVHEAAAAVIEGTQELVVTPAAAQVQAMGGKHLAHKALA
jgi:hypothetical protein